MVAKKLLACMSGVLAVAGSCAHILPPCSGPEPLRVILRASTHLNPGENGESLATTVRIYQLRDLSKFATVSLEQLLDGEQAALGEDLVSVKEITLYPGEVAKPALHRREGVHFLAAAAFFRHPAGSAWRVASKLQSPDPEYCYMPSGVRDARTTLLFGLVESRVELH
jgi:type VI secretion system protein VasD